MRAFIFTTYIGSFGVNESNKIISFKPFPKDSVKIAEKMKLSEIEIIDEEKQVMTEVGSKGYKQFVFPYRKSGAKHVESGSKPESFIKENLRKLAVDHKFIKDQVEFNKFLTQVNLELARVQIKKAVKRDSLVIQTNGAIEELDKSINILIERLREWYGLHFPEMDRIVDSHEKYAKLVEKFGLRKNIDDVELGQFKQKSMGMEITEDDVKTIQLTAKKIVELYQLRESLSKYLDKILKEVAPNLQELAGSAIAAKLIAKAGGLDKLARAPSSTVQLFGAEKALFRYLHGRGKSPKYGIIFSHQLIQNASKEHRGKVARILSSTLSIAAKIDYYSKEYRADGMKKELLEKVKDILSSK